MIISFLMHNVNPFKNIFRLKQHYQFQEQFLFVSTPNQTISLQFPSRIPKSTLFEKSIEYLCLSTRMLNGWNKSTWNSAFPFPGYWSLTSSFHFRNDSSSTTSMSYRFMKKRSSIPVHIIKSMRVLFTA